MKCKPYLLLKCSVMVTCCLLFILQSYQELGKLYKNMTSVAIQTETNEKLRYPTIVICLEDPFKREKYPATLDEFRNITYSLGEIVDIDTTSPNISQGLVMNEVATYFHGMCFVFKLPEDWLYPEWAFIGLKTNKTLHVYFVDKDQELCIIYSSQCRKDVRNRKFVFQNTGNTGMVLARLKAEKRVKSDG